MEQWLDALRRQVPDAVGPFALRYLRFSPRAYFVLPMDQEASARARNVARELTAGPWSRHFAPFG